MLFYNKDKRIVSGDTNKQIIETYQPPIRDDILIYLGQLLEDNL